MTNPFFNFPSTGPFHYLGPAFLKTAWRFTFSNGKIRKQCVSPGPRVRISIRRKPRVKYHGIPTWWFMLFWDAEGWATSSQRGPVVVSGLALCRWSPHSLIKVSEGDTREVFPIPRKPIPHVLSFCTNAQTIHGPLVTMNTGGTDGPVSHGGTAFITFINKTSLPLSLVHTLYGFPSAVWKIVGKSWALERSVRECDVSSTGAASVAAPWGRGAQANVLVVIYRALRVWVSAPRMGESYPLTELLRSPPRSQDLASPSKDGSESDAPAL